MTDRLTKAQLRLVLTHQGFDAFFELYSAMADRQETLERRIEELEHRFGAEGKSVSGAA